MIAEIITLVEQSRLEVAIVGRYMDYIFNRRLFFAVRFIVREQITDTCQFRLTPCTEKASHDGRNHVRR